MNYISDYLVNSNSRTDRLHFLMQISSLTPIKVWISVVPFIDPICPRTVSTKAIDLII